MTLREFFGTLWRGRLEVAAAMVVVLVVAVIYLSQGETTYEATAEVRLASAEAAIGEGELIEVTVPAEQAQLQADDVVAGAAEALGRSPEELVDRTWASVDGLSIDVTAAAPDREEAVALADAFAVAYADWLGEFRDTQVAYFAARRGALADDLRDLGPVRITDGTADDPLAGAERDLIVSEYTTLTVELRTLEAVPEPVATAAPTVDVVELGPAWTTTLAVALLAGLIAGIGLAFARRGLDMRIRDGDAAAELTHAPVLAELRNVHQSTREFRRTQTLPVTSRTATPFTESIRELRTAIEVAVADVEHPVVVITAADKYEARSYITANVAASFGLSGVTVVAVAGDLRRPQLAGLLGRSDADGQAPQVTDIPNVSIRHLPDSQLDPADLLATTAVRDLVEDTRGLADIVLIDAPPVLAAADATILGRYATGTVLVAGAGTTNRTALTQSADRLRTNGVTLAGVALADVKADRRSDYTSTYGDDAAATPPSSGARARPPDKTSRRSARHAPATSSDTSTPADAESLVEARGQGAEEPPRLRPA